MTQRYTASQIRKIFKDWGFPKISREFIDLIGRRYIDSNRQVTYQLSVNRLQEIINRFKVDYDQLYNMIEGNDPLDSEKINNLKSELNKLVRTKVLENKIGQFEINK